MKKETIADFLAKKTFNSPDFQKSWMTHQQAFGPILEPSFFEDYQSRIHLTSALNLISSGDIKGGVKKLQSLQSKCQTDEDKAALLFFIGLAFEMNGQQEHMVEYYTLANEYHHKFYLPYLKVAKYYQNGCLYEHAEKNYLSAVECFPFIGLNEQDSIIVSSAYINLATCLIMMHQYEKAEEMLNLSHYFQPRFSGREATEAILSAIKGDKTHVENCLNILKSHSNPSFEKIKDCTDRILTHSDPHFYPVSVDEQKITEFWNWFKDYKETFIHRINQREYEIAITPVSKKILETFPFLEEPPYISLGKNDSGYIVEMHDMYAIALTDAFNKLLDAQSSKPLESDIQFQIVH